MTLNALWYAVASIPILQNDEAKKSAPNAHIGPSLGLPSGLLRTQSPSRPHLRGRLPTQNPSSHTKRWCSIWPCQPRLRADRVCPTTSRVLPLSPSPSHSLGSRAPSAPARVPAGVPKLVESAKDTSSSASVVVMMAPARDASAMGPCVCTTRPFALARKMRPASAATGRQIGSPSQQLTIFCASELLTA